MSSNTADVQSLLIKAGTKACIVFYLIDAIGDCLYCTDSAGNKRYIIGYLDDGSVFWTRVHAD